METTLTLPFLVNAYGSVNTTTDQEKIWSDRVRFVIGTNLQERIMDPRFGTLVPEALMDTQEAAEVLIRTEVERAFPIHLDLLTLEAVNTSFDEYTNTINVSIIYNLPNNEQVDTLVSLVYISGTNPAVEENL